ncbi:MAG: hypothetical protein WDO69_22650 [Pseudomonadota bacterium]
MPLLTDEQKQLLREEAERLRSAAPTVGSERRLREIALVLGESPGDEEQGVDEALARTIPSD